MQPNLTTFLASFDVAANAPVASVETLDLRPAEIATHIGADPDRQARLGRFHTPDPVASAPNTSSSSHRGPFQRARELLYLATALPGGALGCGDSPTTPDIEPPPVATVQAYEGCVATEPINEGVDVEPGATPPASAPGPLTFLVEHCQVRMSDGTMEAPHSIMVYLNNEEVPAGNITQVTPHTIQLRLPAPVQSGDYDREVFWEAYMGGEQNSSSLRGSRRDAFNVAEPLTEVRVHIEGGLDGEMVPIPGYLRVRRDGTNSRRVVPTDSNGVATFGVPGTQLGVYFIEAMDELDDDAVGDWHNSTEQPYLIGEGGLETSIPLAKAAVLPPDNGYNDDALAFAIDLLGGVTYLAKGHLNVYINPGDRP